MKPSRTVRVSELAEFVYCERSWWLRTVRRMPPNRATQQAQAAGLVWHEAEGQRIARATNVRRFAQEVIARDRRREKMADFAAELGFPTDRSPELLGFLLNQPELIGSLEARLAAQEKEAKQREVLSFAAERMGCPGNLKHAAYLEALEKRIAENHTNCYRRIDQVSEHIDWRTPSNLF